MRAALVGFVVLTLAVPTWQRIQPSTAPRLLAGAGGIPGGREAGMWIDSHLPRGARFLTVGPSMANIIQWYGHRKAYGLSVSSNPLHRNPAYEPLANPDRAIRMNEVHYLVWDRYSAARSRIFSEGIRRYAERYDGRVIHRQWVPLRKADGDLVQRPAIVVYEVSE
jgi:hypothetical protein